MRPARELLLRPAGDDGDEHDRGRQGPTLRSLYALFGTKEMTDQTGPHISLFACVHNLGGTHGAQGLSAWAGTSPVNAAAVRETILDRAGPFSVERLKLNPPFATNIVYKLAHSIASPGSPPIVLTHMRGTVRPLPPGGRDSFFSRQLGTKEMTRRRIRQGCIISLVRLPDQFGALAHPGFLLPGRQHAPYQRQPTPKQTLTPTPTNAVFSSGR